MIKLDSICPCYFVLTAANVRMKRKFIISIFIFLLIDAFLLWHSYKLHTNITKINNTWDSYKQNFLIKNDLLNQLRHGFGYGGFIHNFKNYIIHRDSISHKKVADNLKNTYSLLSNFKQLSLSSEEKSALHDIEAVISEYSDKYHALDVMLKQQPERTIQAIDNIARVDDTPAILAFDVLAKQLNLTLNKNQQETENQIKLTRKQQSFLMYIAQPVIIIAILFYAFYLFRLEYYFKEVQAIFKSTPDALIVSDINGQIINVNQKAQDLFGYSHKEFIRLTIEDLLNNSSVTFHKNLRDKFVKETIIPEMKKNKFVAIMGFERSNQEFQAKTRDNKSIPVKVLLTSYYQQGQLRIIASITDITEKKQLQSMASKDGLTSLLNRRALDEKLNNEFERAKRYQRNLSVIFVDIDHFKQVNDTYGHQAGDDALKAVANILDNRIRQSDTVGRYGGEEFLIVCPETNNDTAFRLAESIRKDIELLTLDQVGHITASFGISIYMPKENINTVNLLIEQADSALYKAKHNGRNQVVIS